MIQSETSENDTRKWRNKFYGLHASYAAYDYAEQYSLQPFVIDKILHEAAKRARKESKK